MKCSEALVLSVSAAAIAVSDGLTVEQISLLGAVATQFGDTLTTIAAAQGSENSETAPTSST